MSEITIPKAMKIHFCILHFPHTPLANTVSIAHGKWAIGNEAFFNFNMWNEMDFFYGYCCCCHWHKYCILLMAKYVFFFSLLSNECGLVSSISLFQFDASVYVSFSDYHFSDIQLANLFFFSHSNKKKISSVCCFSFPFHRQRQLTKPSSFQMKRINHKTNVLKLKINEKKKHKKSLAVRTDTRTEAESLYQSN